MSKGDIRGHCARCGGWHRLPDKENPMIAAPDEKVMGVESVDPNRKPQSIKPKSPKPCPACGGADIVLGSSLGESPWRLLCRNPGCWYAGPWRKTIAEADAVWNAMPRRGDTVMIRNMEPEDYRIMQVIFTKYGIPCEPLQYFTPAPSAAERVPSGLMKKGTLSEPDQSGSRIRSPGDDGDTITPKERMYYERRFAARGCYVSEIRAGAIFSIGDKEYIVLGYWLPENATGWEEERIVVRPSKDSSPGLALVRLLRPEIVKVYLSDE